MLVRQFLANLVSFWLALSQQLIAIYNGHDLHSWSQGPEEVTSFVIRVEYVREMTAKKLGK